MTRTLAIPLLCISCGFSAAHANYVLSFAEGSSVAETDSGVNTLTWDLDTALSTISTDDGNAADAGLNSWVGLSGTGTQNASFSLLTTAGFDFDVSNPAYDSSAYAPGEPPVPAPGASILKITSDGFFPMGPSNRFSPGEILHFTVSGLASDQRLVLTGYTIIGNNPDRVNLYYGNDATFFDTPLTGIGDTSGESISLSNGQQFGFGYNRTSGGSRGGLSSLTFDIVAVPEPSTFVFLSALLAFVSTMLRRRR